MALNSKTNAREYTDDEVHILVTMYPHYGIDACLPHLPGRSKISVRSKVADMGLSLTGDAQSNIRRAARLKAHHQERKQAKEPTKAPSPPFLFAPSVFTLGQAMLGKVEPVKLAPIQGRVHLGDEYPIDAEDWVGA